MNEALDTSLKMIFPSAAFYLHAAPILALLVGGGVIAEMLRWLHILGGIK